jgi:uncharacterized protein DUF4268
VSDFTVGKLLRGNLREFWKREDVHFTPWLAGDGNIAALAEVLGLEQLDEVQTEVSVGDFSLDILAKDTLSGTLVAVENQFHKGDHGHLGQLITYAAGISSRDSNRKIFVWLAEHLRDEHRSALDWLNRTTNADIGFWGIELEVWQIVEPNCDKSSPALRFNVVCRPNELEKAIAQTAATPSPGDQRYLEFWEGFRDSCALSQSTLNLRPPAAKYWQSSSIGRAGFGVNFTVSNTKKRMAAELYIDHKAAHRALALLESDQSLRKEIGADAEFQKLNKHARIARYTPHNIADRESWPQLFTWLRKNGEDFQKMFQSRVKALDLDQQEDEEEGNKNSQ